MTKDLSKQLCELCGIKPNFFALMQSEENWEEIPESVYYKIKDCSTTKIIYPDFTKPENFVGLFNLKWYFPDEEYGRQEANLSFYVLFNLANSSKDWNTEGFIRLLIKALKEHNTYAESIKQSIREAEWVYE